MTAARDFPNSSAAQFSETAIDAIIMTLPNGQTVTIPCTPIHIAATAEPARNFELVPRPIDEWDEDQGCALWWCWRDGAWLGEPPYIGSPLDLGQTVECHTHAERGATPAARFTVGGWPGYHTHWTPLPSQPYAPDQVILPRKDSR